MKLRKGDEVKIIKGKDKNKTGKIEKVFVKSEKVLITGLNQYKRHIKGRSTGGQKSEIITISKPVSIANVLFVCPKCHEPTRVGYKVSNKTKIRVCKKCEETI